MRGERFLAAGVNAAGGRRFRDRIAAQASRYWATPTQGRWEADSHWRNGIGEMAWREVGVEHWSIYSMFAGALAIPAPGRVIEWGAGGGANAVAFAPHAQAFIATDVSDNSLDECVRQVRAVCDTPISTRRIDLKVPEQAVADLRRSCDTFLCFYVLELTAGADAVKRILRIASELLAPGGLAVIQVKYHTDDRRTRGRPGVRYTRNIATTTTFGIEEFWALAIDCGLEPQLLTLVPVNRLDKHYAYYGLIRPDSL